MNRSINYRKFLLASLFLFFFCDSPRSLLASDFCPTQNTFLTSSIAENKIDLSPYLSFFSSHDLSLNIETVLKQLPSVKFESTHNAIPNFGKTELIYWFCFRIKNDQKIRENLTAYIRYPLLDEVTFVDLSSDHQIKSETQGRLYPFSERDSIYRGFSHPVYLSPEEQQTIYIRVKTQSSMSVPIFIVKEKQFQEFVSLDYFYQGLYFGIVGIMALYNLFVFILVRDKAYLYYVMYLIFGSVLFQLSLNGLLAVIFFPNAPHLVFNAHNLLYFAFLFFTIPMCITFMNLKDSAPLVYKIQLSFLAIPILCILVLPYFSYRTMNQVGDIFSMSLALVSLVTSYYIAFSIRYRPAYYFYFAFLFVIIGGIATLFKYMGFLPVNFFTDNAFQISMGIEVLLMAFGLGDRIAIVRKEKEKIQFRAEINKQKLNAFQKELLLAQKLQESTLPTKLPYHPNIQILAGYKPASVVGGDFYDIIKLNESEITCLIADVTGHGVPAAIEAAMLKIAFVQTLRFASSPGLILEKINRSLVGSYKNQLLTASSFYLNLDSKILTVANAGHPPLYLLRENTKKIESIRPAGKLIGYSRDLSYHEEEYNLDTNDRLLLCTDGLWEIWERDALGEKSLADGSGETNLVNWLHQNWHLELNDLIHEMETFISVRSHNTPPDDDITYLLFKIS